MEWKETPYFPMFVNLEGKKIVVFGAGRIALRRIRTLQFFHAQILVEAPDIPETVRAEMQALEGEGAIVYRKKDFEETDLDDGADMVLAATGDRQLNERIYHLCKARNILVNNASDRHLCDFYFPAVAENGEIIAGITGNGTNHKKVAAAAAGIRTYLEKLNEENNTDRQPGE